MVFLEFFKKNLLSSIRGTAVTAIQIDGVCMTLLHQRCKRRYRYSFKRKVFSFKSSSDDTKKLILDAKGPGIIKESNTPVNEIEILNPDLVICNLDENTLFSHGDDCGNGKDMSLNLISQRNHR